MKKVMWGFQISSEKLEDAVYAYTRGECQGTSEREARRHAQDLADMLTKEGTPSKPKRLIKITIETVPYED